MADKKDKAEQTEQPGASEENERSNSSGNAGDGDGDGAGVVGKDLGATGSGNGALERGSDGSSGDGGGSSGDSGDGSGDSGDSGGDSLGDTGGLRTIPGGDLGSGDTPRKRGRPRGSRTGDNRATGTGGRTGASSGKRTDGHFRNLGQDAPRVVKPEELGDEKEDFAKFSKSEKQKFAADIISTVFDMVAGLTGAEHWRLTGREAADLAKAILDVADTFPAKQSKKLEKYLKEYAPYISLLMVGFTVVYPRAIYTYANGTNRNAKRNNDPGDFAASGTGGSGKVPNSEGAGMGFESGRQDGTDDVQTYFGQYFQ